MSFLIDTNVISEVRKGSRCNPNVAAWYGRVDEADLHLSVLVVGEIRKGIEKARAPDPGKAAALEQWLGDVIEGFAHRILPLELRVTQEWGRMSAIRSVPVVDALMAATAKVNGLTLVTRNAADVRGLGAAIFNPFEQEG